MQLRFDDTNPVKEDIEYESMKTTQWLGFHWSGDVCYSSDYFDQLHQYAVELINKGWPTLMNSLLMRSANTAAPESAG